jgi:hypothetical protein
MTYTVNPVDGTISGPTDVTVAQTTTGSNLSELGGQVSAATPSLYLSATPVNNSTGITAALTLVPPGGAAPAGGHQLPITLPSNVTTLQQAA